MASSARLPGLAPGTAPWVLVPLALGLTALVLPLPYARAAGLVLVVLALLLAAFFRDPHREVGAGVVAPADGRVQAVEAGDEELRIVTFMNLHDIHVNRAPLGGRVVDRTRWSGGHRPAFLGGSDANERVAYRLETPVGPVELTQVTGAFARRIDPWVGPDDEVERGQRVGMIRFGSRVDLALPPELEPAVEPGDRVRAAESTLAEAPP
jgi:phosphatidylserine decarboxylase